MKVFVAGGGGDDAASAAISALVHGRGVYNVVDDSPAPAREWIPAFCTDVGAPAPMRVPAWLATLLVGGFAVATLTVARGASNAKAKRELGWMPAHPTWRAGFLPDLGG